ncbi:hypothetical protein DV515_00010020, partial [Chloebia gouldiae]
GAAGRQRGRLRLHPGWRRPWLLQQSVILPWEPAEPVAVTGGLPQGCWRKYRSSGCPNSCGVSANIGASPPSIKYQLTGVVQLCVQRERQFHGEVSRLPSRRMLGDRALSPMALTF